MFVFIFIISFLVSHISFFFSLSLSLFSHSVLVVFTKVFRGSSLPFNRLVVVDFFRIEPIITLLSAAPHVVKE